jgi:SiaC family regulatory phosphoprotein
MENLIIEETKYTPAISLDVNGTVSIVGKSYPENTFEFYAPVMEWLAAYFEEGNKKLTLNMEITYFNSSSSKLFFDMFDLLDENNSDELVINWIYDEDNESALEAGEDFKDDFEDLTINFVTK